MKLNKITALIISISLIGALNLSCASHLAATATATSTATAAVSSGTPASASAPSTLSVPGAAAILTPSPTPEPTIEPTIKPTIEPTITPSPTPEPEILYGSAIETGDYIKMGRYYNEPILWRCVDTDDNGLLMLADRILTIKAFDAAGNHKYLDGTAQPDGDARIKYGSNLWETSNLRSWLNSTAAAGKVTWPDGCPPVKSGLRNNLNEYANEKGFLASGNFTESERNAILSVTQKSMLDGLDAVKLQTGGTENYAKDISSTPYMKNLLSVLQNYDIAFFQNVTDRIFIPDVKQLNNIYRNKSILGEDYYIGKPTQKLIDNAEYKDTTFLLTTKYWYYWLRTPQPQAASWVQIVSSKGVYCDSANDFYVGVRPAFYMNPAAVILKYAAGNSKANPYVVK
ncbi:MAG: DUF6273 domain-containing protein [Saccharofermentanales bacterium]